MEPVELLCRDLINPVQSSCRPSGLLFTYGNHIPCSVISHGIVPEQSEAMRVTPRQHVGPFSCVDGSPNLAPVRCIGGHLVRYPWSAIPDWAWYRNFRYWTETAKSDIISDIRIKFYPICDIRHPLSTDSHSSLVLKRSRFILRGESSNALGGVIFFLQCRISEWTLMSISKHFRYRNDVFQFDIFVSDIGITDVDVGCRISPTLRSMSMPTYGEMLSQTWGILCSPKDFFSNLKKLV